jgi:hypothetical protein
MSTNSAAVPGWIAGRRVLHEFVVDTKIGQCTADSTACRAQGSTRKRHQEDQADQRTPVHLIELDGSRSAESGHLAQYDFGMQAGHKGVNFKTVFFVPKTGLLDFSE